MNDSKYIMAIISVPIEITPEGDQITHSDLYKVDFTVLDYLPPPSVPIVEINIAELFSQIAVKTTDELAFRASGSDIGESSGTGLESFNDEPSDIEDTVSEITDNAEYPNYVSDCDNEEDENYEDGFISGHTSVSLGKSDDDAYSCTFYENPENVQEKEIVKRKPFSKSKTIRRTHYTPAKRFSRRINNRLIHIPQPILCSLNL